VSDASNCPEVISLSVVIPVYRGEETLPELISELQPLTLAQETPDGRLFRIDEILLVWDRGPAGSDTAIRELSSQFSFVKPVWLSRNFGQHAATIAGMSSSGGQWIVTMDEDGQQDPRFIPELLDCAYRERAQLVYGTPSNPPPHSKIRNLAWRHTPERVSILMLPLVG
jgi:polyisoprenyl-phosphate glycosyltransferase